ncbi:MAG: hypothetical protein ACFCVD_06195 [Nodosilinea sp.]
MSSFSSGVTPPPRDSASAPLGEGPDPSLVGVIASLLENHINRRPSGFDGVVQRLAAEIDRICRMSDRIQASGAVAHWQTTLVGHRVSKCLNYYDLGSSQGRIELHSSLSAIVYRYMAPTGSHLGFQGRYALLEDFMQTFYIEVINAFRREHGLPATYTPRTRLELAEYMAFGEQYAKRRITLRGRQGQQLIVLRAQAFSRRQPAETPVDMGLVSEGAKTEEGEAHARSSVFQQVRDKMMSEDYDAGDTVMRDRVVNALMQYLKEQDQADCVDYLVLKLEDCSAAEIDDILGLSARKRDYLQQRFKYHVEKFAQHHQWELVHQWLGANLEAQLGMTLEEWSGFLSHLSPEQRQLVDLKQGQPADPTLTDEAIAERLGWTPKKVQRNWSQVLKLAWEYRNQSRTPQAVDD